MLPDDAFQFIVTLHVVAFELTHPLLQIHPYRHLAITAMRHLQKERSMFVDVYSDSFGGSILSFHHTVVMKLMHCETRHGGSREGGGKNRHEADVERGRKPYVLKRSSLIRK